MLLNITQFKDFSVICALSGEDGMITIDAVKDWVPTISHSVRAESHLRETISRSVLF
jgi:hypothetical protein